MNNADDMRGRTCLVTGATSGHGRAVALELARRGADIVLLGRNREKCDAVRDKIRGITGRAPVILLCDLASLSEVRRAAAEFLNSGRPLHLLVNNAGQVNERYRETVDGYEETFAVNYLAMYTLTLLLLDRMRESAPARIINVSSDTHVIARIDLDDVTGRTKRYGFMAAYGRSKLAIVYFTRELAPRLTGSGITVNAVDPGPIASGIAKKNSLVSKVSDAIIQLTFPKPDRAARTAIYLATSPDLDGRSGEYWRFMKKKEPTVSADPGFGARLWEKTARMTGVDIAAKKN